MTCVRARRLRHARAWLERANDPVDVIAWNAGYTDIVRFQHAFRKAPGQSPQGLSRRKKKAADTDSPRRLTRD